MMVKNQESKKICQTSHKKFFKGNSKKKTILKEYEVNQAIKDLFSFAFDKEGVDNFLNREYKNYYEIFKHFGEVYNIYSSSIWIKCPYCGKETEKSLNDMIKLLGEKKKKFLSGVFICGSKSCKADHKRAIIVEQTRMDDCSAKGNHKFKDMKKYKEVRREISLKMWEGREKRDLESLYGKEKADKMKRVSSEKAKNNSYHLGHRNSEETKNRMSKKRLEFLSSLEAKEKSWELPNGEMVDHQTYLNEMKRINYKNMSEEEKEERRKKTTIGIIKSFDSGTRKKYQGWHKAWWQEFIDSSYDQKFLSSYEEEYYKILDKEKVYYKYNNTIYLPYIHPVDEEVHYYIPDVLIFNEDFSILKEIHEVKPYVFAYNPRRNNSDYYRITKEKINVLKRYCDENKYECRIITELDLGFKLKGASLDEIYKNF